MMARPMRTTNRQGGIALIEGLVAILIFSIGILAAIGMQARAVSAVTGAKDRLDASLVANEQVGRMWANPTALSSVTDQPVPSLPEGKLNVTVSPTSEPKVFHVVVVVTWRPPGASADSNFRQSVQINHF